MAKRSIWRMWDSESGTSLRVASPVKDASKAGPWSPGAHSSHDGCRLEKRPVLPPSSEERHLRIGHSGRRERGGVEGGRVAVEVVGLGEHAEQAADLLGDLALAAHAAAEPAVGELAAVRVADPGEDPLLAIGLRAGQPFEEDRLNGFG